MPLSRLALPRPLVALAGLAALLSLSLGASGCSSDSSDGGSAGASVLVEVSTDLGATDLGSLDLSVVQGEDVALIQTYSLPQDATLPATLRLVTKGSSTGATGTLPPGIIKVAAGPLVVQVGGTKTDGGMVSRSARLEMPSSGEKLLRVKLEKACVGVTCEDGSTCVAGMCEADAVDVGALPSP